MEVVLGMMRKETACEDYLLLWVCIKYRRKQRSGGSIANKSKFPETLYEI